MGPGRKWVVHHAESRQASMSQPSPFVTRGWSAAHAAPPPAGEGQQLSATVPVSPFGLEAVQVNSSAPPWLMVI
jgi:hypothetical protein